MKQYATNLTDLVKTEVMVEDMAKQLENLQLGLQLMQRSWGTSYIGLPMSVHAVYSLKVQTAGCLALLLSMVENAGGLIPEQGQTVS